MPGTEAVPCKWQFSRVEGAGHRDRGGGGGGGGGSASSSNTSPQWGSLEARTPLAKPATRTGKTFGLKRDSAHKGRRPCLVVGGRAPQMCGVRWVLPAETRPWAQPPCLAPRTLPVPLGPQAGQSGGAPGWRKGRGSVSPTAQARVKWLLIAQWGGPGQRPRRLGPDG